MFQHLSFCEICRTVRSVDSWIMLSYLLGFCRIIYAGAAGLIRTLTYIYSVYIYILYMFPHTVYVHASTQVLDVFLQRCERALLHQRLSNMANM